jgi:hypothetical protein
MIPLFVLLFTLFVVFASSTSSDQHFFEIVALCRPPPHQDLGRLLVVLASSASGDQPFLESLYCADRHPIRNGDERGRLVTASPVMTKS